MTEQEAVEVIKANWPPENYTMLREALTLATKALDEITHQKEIQKVIQELAPIDGQEYREDQEREKCQR